MLTIHLINLLGNINLVIYSIVDTNAGFKILSSHSKNLLGFAVFSLEYFNVYVYKDDPRHLTSISNRLSTFVQLKSFIRGVLI